MRALDTAATGMAAQDLKVQVIAGNIANMATTGFKSQRAEFQDLIYEHVQRIGAQASDNGNILPVGIERIVTRAAGGQLYMSAKERYHVDNEYCYDLEVFDADGYLVEVLQGFRCRILEAYTDAVALEKIAGIHQEAADRARLHEQEGEAA